MIKDVMYVFIRTSLLYEVPGGNQVDGLPPAASNGGWEDCSPLGRRLCMANAVFFCHVLMIHLSELLHISKRTHLGWQGMILCDRHVCYYHEC